MTMNLPVLIVGAGAAGTVLALELIRRDIPFRLVDRLPGPSNRSRAVTIHARTIEIFEAIDPELAQRFLHRGYHCPGYVMRYVDEQGQRSVVKPGLDFRHLESAYPLLLLHGQDETEQTLRNYLLEKFGFSPEWGVSCETVSNEDGGVVAELLHADGTKEIVECRYLIACDGARSSIRTQLGLAQEGSDYAETVLQNLDVELHGLDDSEYWANYCMGHGHFLMVVPMPGGYYRLLMSQPADKADADATPHHVFGGIIDQHFDGVTFGKTRWHSRWGSMIRLAHTYRSGNVFLAGDAAHVHSTAGGQGMNCCIQDAFNLGWKLAMVVRSDAGDALLDTYGHERRPVGEQVIQAASGIHELFMTGRNAGPEKLREMVQSGVMDALVHKVSGLGYACKPSAEEPDCLPLEGERMPDLLLASGESFYTLLRGHYLHLVAATRSGALSASFSVFLQEAQGNWPFVRVVEITDAPDFLLGEHGEDCLWLVRPDTWLAGRSCSPEMAWVRKWFIRFALT